MSEKSNIMARGILIWGTFLSVSGAVALTFGAALGLLSFGFFCFLVAWVDKK